jgi:hypothetical protein
MDSVVAQFANTAAAALTRTVTGITKEEKCSWVVSAASGAPSFLITTTNDLISNDPTTGWVIHYVEYGDKVNC